MRTILNSRLARYLYLTVIGLALLATLFFGFLAMMVVPAPAANTAVEVSGRVAAISRPDPQYGDLTIRFQDGRRFYVNRADELAYFDWPGLLAEVEPGDTLYLTTVPAKAWQLLSATPYASPVAGVWTASTVYLDPQIPAESWTAQAAATRLATVALVILLLLLAIPIALSLSRRQPPAAVTVR